MAKSESKAELDADATIKAANNGVEFDPERTAEEVALDTREPDGLPEQTDNNPRPEDGKQDLSQDPDTVYRSEVED